MEISTNLMQWRNVGGLVEMAPLGGKKSPSSGAPGLRAYWGAICEKMAEKSKKIVKLLNQTCTFASK